jgi:hypothetical protein
MVTGHWDASSASVNRSQESTWPPLSCWRAAADAVTEPAISNKVPASFCSATSLRAASAYTAAPRRKTTRTEIWLLPQPKLAMAADASAVRSRLLTMFLTAPVTTTTAERSGPTAPGLSRSGCCCHLSLYEVRIPSYREPLRKPALPIMGWLERADLMSWGYQQIPSSGLLVMDRADWRDHKRPSPFRRCPSILSFQASPGR